MEILTNALFFGTVGFALAVVNGINLSAEIEDTIMYFLFWFMYMITLATFVNIGLSAYYYVVMKDKTGPRGPRGERGDKGEPGKVGQCGVSCRNSVCETSIRDHIISILAAEEKKSGSVKDIGPSDLQNIYIKEKVKSMCQSPEFQQMSAIKGPVNLVNYMKTIWTDIIKRLYQSGGMTYFRTIGAENDWDWLDDNPWNEFKKYDVYYWGMGKDYRPILTENCNSGTEPGKPDNKRYPHVKNPMTSSAKSSDKVYRPPSKRDPKYSILSYISIPSGKQEGVAGDGLNPAVFAFNKSNNTGVRMYNAFTYKPTKEVTDKYYTAKDAKRAVAVKPMSYLISSQVNPTACVGMNKAGATFYRTCDPWDPEQIFTMKFTGEKDSKMREFRIKNMATGMEVKNNGNIVRRAQVGDTYKF